MPSEAEAAPGGEGSSRLAWLRSQGLGVACGLGTVALLAIGSFVLAATGEGASAGIAMDDARAFFERPSPVHAWFYLLVPLLGLYALNTLLATWHAVSRRWRAGVRAPSAYGAAVMHLAFLVALLAHGVGGFLGQERGQVVVSRGWTPLPDGGEVRLASLEVDSLPGGMPREVRAAVETRRGDGSAGSAVVGYNQPLSSGLGSDLWLLGEMGRAPAAHLLAGPERCVAAEGTDCRLAGLRVTVRRAVPAAFGGQAMALVRLDAAGMAVERWVAPGGAVELGDATVRLAGIGAEPAVALRGRHAPGNPWALASAVLLAAGVALVWRRFLPPRRERWPAPDDDLDPELEAASGD